MDKNLFRYVWRHSRRDQLIIFGVVLASLPFYFFSLDLPRRIVNEAIQGRAFQGGQATAPFLSLSIGWPEWLGGSSKIELFSGFQVDRLGLLLGLSLLFLLLVLVNGGFKYWINVAKGALGERMLRRMRFDLFALVLRFTPEALRSVKSSETATIIKDEVEPIGGFIGDAFVLPLFLGTQAATALIFILIQNIWLGLLAGGIVGVQFLIIPRMRRELLRLGKQRQLDIGQLVAVIAAYRELPPPLKELIDWDQQRLDVQVKYDQVVQHFAPERLLPVDAAAEGEDDRPLVGPLVAEEVS